MHELPVSPDHSLCGFAWNYFYSLKKRFERKTLEQNEQVKSATLIEAGLLNSRTRLIVRLYPHRMMAAPSLANAVYNGQTDSETDEQSNRPIGVVRSTPAAPE
jgi:hypothetical protein